MAECERYSSIGKQRGRNCPRSWAWYKATIRCGDVCPIIFSEVWS